MPSAILNRRLVGASGFNPANYGAGTLKAWFKADSLSLSDGAAVSTWLDSSSNGNHATAGTAPTFKMGIQNGKPGVLFVGASSQFLTADGLASVQNGTDLPFSAFIALRQVTTAGTQAHCHWGRAASNTSTQYVAQTGTSYLSQRRDDASTLANQVGGTIGTVTVIDSWVFPGTTMSLWENGTSIIAAGAQDVGAITIDRFSLGAFRGSSNTSFFDGYLFEVIIYASAVSTADRQIIERALGAKWGVTVA